MPSTAMSETLVVRVRQSAASAAVATAWAQWGRLGFHAEGGTSRADEVLIDPEALLVLTFEAVRHEPRLDQALDWWAARGSSLISLPRVDFVVATTGRDLTALVGTFAARIWGHGNASGSWKRRAEKAGVGAAVGPDRIKGRAKPNVLHPAAAMLRTRSIAGGSAKADLIAYLAARGPQPSSFTLMEQKALGYSRSSLFYGCEDLALAGVATLQKSTPLQYTFRPGVIDLGDVPPWRFWPQIVAFLLGAARWGESLTEPTPFLLGDQARTLHARLLAFHSEHPLPADYPVADPRAHPGPEYLEPFAETVESVSSWLADGLPA